MDITPLTSDTRRGKDGSLTARKVDDKPGDGGTEERMCDRAADTGSAIRKALSS